MTREADLVASSGVNNAIQGKSCAETRIARASLEAIRQKLTLTRAGSWLNCSQRGYQRPTSRCGGDTNRTHKPRGFHQVDLSSPVGRYSACYFNCFVIGTEIATFPARR